MYSIQYLYKNDSLKSMRNVILIVLYIQKKHSSFVFVWQSGPLKYGNDVDISQQ